MRLEFERNMVNELKFGLSIGMLSLVGVDHVNRNVKPGWFLIGNVDVEKWLLAGVEAMKLLYKLVFDYLQLVRFPEIVAADDHLMIK